MAGLNALQGVLRSRRSQDRGKSLQDEPGPMDDQLLSPIEAGIFVRMHTHIPPKH